ncbi:MAG TPA: 2-oxoglutarate dehydrogenase E1 component [Planctomycetota bacterium]|nr:2-oxoglutarate dehydrogenase E1 component [Planctomycetota bacterium]
MDLDAYRRWGYLAAGLDSLGRLGAVPVPELEPPSPEGRRWYCGSIGTEFMHLRDPQRRRFIQERLEADPPRLDPAPILDLLVRCDTLEKFLQRRYIGTKRYSLEGSDAVLPILAAALDVAAGRGATEVVLGMSHRGRLNVMVNIVGKSAEEILTRFEDVDPNSMLGGGDVKYHLGATGRSRGGMEVSLSPNPSHLEAVDPVALGRARGRQDRLGSEGRSRVVPITLHGDAAFAGQGMLSETLNLADLPGYTAGGTLQILVNNLIGFTTGPAALHSTRFAADAARRLEIPILHVNGEDPEAAVRAARLAMEYRCQFGSDVVLDLICYRRHGHSEVDDPTVTQPRLYGQLKRRQPLWQLYAADRGLDGGALAASVNEELEKSYERAKAATHGTRLMDLPRPWNLFQGGKYEATFEVDTGVDPSRLGAISEKLTAVPEGFRGHPKVLQLLELRRQMGRGAAPVDWGMAEALALGSLLSEGLPVRLSGEDTRRGTFNQRHAVLVDSETEAEHVPLGSLGPLELYDSPLSEAGVLGFEYGYSLERPEGLVLWEAQFGDFANGAQVILDQYLTAAEDKWGVLSGLVLLLPHGFEGQGPEHSSARVERFLQLAAEDNIQVCQPSTASQYFHLLRRQALRRWRKPLVVLTPKSLLRNPGSHSPIAQLASGRFHPVLAEGDPEGCRRVLLCSGKLGHELLAERKRRRPEPTTVLFLEQFYPFPETELREELERRPGADLVWVQEEPANMGGLSFVLPRLARLSGGRPVRTVKRSESASPATGSMKAHEIEQSALLSLAFMDPH